MTGESLYGIGAVAKMLGVAQQTLRTWEDRYGQIVPERTPGGQRLYSRDQVDQLLFVVQAIARGIQPADAHRLLADRSRQPMDTQGELDPTTPYSSQTATISPPTSASTSCAQRATPCGPRAT